MIFRSSGSLDIASGLRLESIGIFLLLKSQAVPVHPVIPFDSVLKVLDGFGHLPNAGGIPAGDFIIGIHSLVLEFLFKKGRPFDGSGRRFHEISAASPILFFFFSGLTAISGSSSTTLASGKPGSGWILRERRRSGGCCLFIQLVAVFISLPAWFLFHCLQAINQTIAQQTAAFK